MKKVLVKASALLAGVLTLLPLPALAISDPGIAPDESANVSDIGGFIGSILITVGDWMLAVAGLLTVLYLIWAGIQYITGSGGGPEAAKKQIINAVIGIIVIVLAYAIISAAKTLVGSS
ncbi:MAG: hypothetical protein V1826_01550 [bacterium]